MKTNWQHQKDAITTDQKNLTDDEHVHEQDKRDLKQSELNGAPTGRKGESKPADSKVRKSNRRRTT
jgi:hypothetical protein